MIWLNVLQHSDLSDDARSSVLQMHTKDLHDALHYKPDEGASSGAEGSQHAASASQVSSQAP